MPNFRPLHQKPDSKLRKFHNVASLPKEQPSTSDSHVPHSCTHDEIATGISAHLRQAPDPLELQPAAEKIVVSGAFPNNEEAWRVGDIADVIRDPNDLSRLAFLCWNNGMPAVLHEIERSRKHYVPPPKCSGLLASMVLPDRIKPCGATQELAADLETVILRFVDCDPADVQMSVAVLLASWVPECFETVPYLWLVGPLGSAKTQLLKVLRCLCRRSVLVGDIRPAALYQLVHDSGITLLIDELDLDGSRRASETVRLLRTGNTRGTDTIRNGQHFSTFCFKVLASRLPPTDAALVSRSLFLSMHPTMKCLQDVDDRSQRWIIQEFQPRLLAFRFQNLSPVRQYQFPQQEQQDLTPRMRQLAVVLLAPLHGDPQRQAALLRILRERDSDNRTARSLEPEWLVVEALYRICDENHCDGGQVCEILAGDVANEVRDMLSTRGEEPKFSAHRAGAVLRALGIKTERIGNRGRGIDVKLPFRRKVHQLARDFGLDRRVLVSPTAIKAGYGGGRCLLCEEFGLTAGLRFVTLDPPRPRRIISEHRVHHTRRPIFDQDSSDVHGQAADSDSD